MPPARAPARGGGVLAFALLAGALILLALNFYDWPPNRDVTTYATVARELRLGKWLYVDVWDIKPPAIFAAYGAAQVVAPSPPLQFFLLDLVPSLVVLAALLRAGVDAGFGRAAGIWSGLFWVALSGNIRFQMHEPNTEVFINACSVAAFLLLLRLRAGSGFWAPLSVGVLCGVACLFKTVAIAVAGLVGLAHLAFQPAGAGRAQAARQLALMAAGGAAALGAVVLYFAATDRFGVFREVLVDAGLAYAGDVRANLLAALTLAPILGVPPSVGLPLVVGAFAGLALAGWRDRERRRSWALLGAYGLSALVAVGLPGRFYAHYAQLLVPPLCLGLGWSAALFAPRPGRAWRLAPQALLAVLLALAAARGARDYLRTPEERLRGVTAELYLETQKLGRRLGRALSPDEELYQVGEESGLYWYSGKRPTATWGVVQLVQGPQAPRLLALTLESLPARPPALVVVAKRMLDRARDHPVFAWVAANYRPVEPADPGERKFFTFYVPRDASTALVARVLGGPSG